MKQNPITRRAFALSSIGLTALALFVVTVMSTVQAPAAEQPISKPDGKKKPVKVFILAGQSNMECTIGLPKEGYSGVEISANGKSFYPIPSQTVGSKLILKLSQKDLVDGKVILKFK